MHSVLLALLLGARLASTFVVQIPAFITNPSTLEQYSMAHGSRRPRHSRQWLSGTEHFGEVDELTPEIMASLTVPQLKQQLRLRGLKVSGKKQELMDRLLQSSTASVTSPTQTDPVIDAELLSEAESDLMQSSKKSKARQLAEGHGKELVDVTAYLDEDEIGKKVKVMDLHSDQPIEAENTPAEPTSESSSNPEVWGSEAKIVDDYEGRVPIVDGLSRTIVEYRGSNQTQVQAYAVASRDALKPFLAGGAKSVCKRFK